MTIKISQLNDITTVTGNVILPLVSNATGTLTTVQGNVDQLKTYILGTIESDVSSLLANAGNQDDSLSSIESNVATLQDDVTTLYSDLGNVTNGTTTFGNLVPSANVTYNLGSETAQWKDLYLSGSTIYLGGATMSYDGSAVLFDQPLAPFSLQVTGVSTFEGIDLHQSSWGITGAGTAALYVGDPSSLWGEGALVVETNNANGNGIVPSNADMYSLGTIDFPWSAVYTGNLRFTDLSEQTTAFSQYFVDEIGNILGNVANAQIDISTVQSDITTLQGNILTLEGNISTINGEITTLNINGAGIFADIANLQSDTSFTMSNYQHWTSNVTTINDALNQLAERLWNIENP